MQDSARFLQNPTRSRKILQGCKKKRTFLCKILQEHFYSDVGIPCVPPNYERVSQLCNYMQQLTYKLLYSFVFSTLCYLYIFYCANTQSSSETLITCINISLPLKIILVTDQYSFKVRGYETQLQLHESFNTNNYQTVNHVCIHKQSNPEQDILGIPNHTND